MGYLLAQFIRLLPSLPPGLLRSDGTAQGQLRDPPQSPVQELRGREGCQIPQGFRLHKPAAGLPGSSQTK